SLPLGQLPIEKVDRFAHFAAAAAEVLLAEDVDQALGNVLREPGVGGIGQVTPPAGGGDLKNVLLVADDLDVFSQVLDRAFHLAGAGHRLAEAGRTNDLREIGGARHRLADPLDVLLASGGADAD